MDYLECCPSCEADDVTVNRKRDTLECNICGYRGAARAEAARAATLHLSPAGDPELVAFCRRLVDAPEAPWVEAVMADWPGPIAHEYYRLWQLLGEGQIVGALWQLKDVTEVLVRFPTLVMARDVIESGQNPTLPEKARAELRDLAREVRGILLGPPLSLGSWLKLAASTLATPIQKAPERFGFAALAGLFRRPPTKAEGTPKASALAKELEALTEVRNRVFAHGAFQLDFADARKALAEHIPKLNRRLAEHAELWRGLELRIGAPDGEPLTGACSIRHRHDAAPPAPHPIETEPLWLVAGERPLRIAPYVALRRCTVCAKRDVFLYDWRRLRDEGRDRYGFIDFLSGHAMAWPWHEDTELHAETTKGLAAPKRPEGSGDAMVQDYVRTDITRLLEERALEAHYLSPGYLREPLGDFINTRERGVFWLQAPAHVGKSLFVCGLDPRLQAELKEGPLLEKLAVVAFYVRREYQSFREQFRDQLQLRLREVFGIEPQRRGLPMLDLDAADSATAFATWLGDFLAIGGALDQKLLVCIDGLDELRREPDGNILDFIPSSEALPKGVYLLLTSRPPQECPGWVRDALADRYDSPEACHLHWVGLEHRPYRELLERYFDARMRPRLESLASSRMKEVLAGTRVPDEGSTSALPQGLRDSFAAEWRRLQAEHGQTSAALPFPECALGAILAELAALRAQVLDKADGRFLYVSYLSDLLADHTLPLTAVDRLPPAEHLFEHYLTELERIQSDKPNELLRRVLLHLTAVEEAHREDAKTLPAAALEDWRGLPLDVLSELVEGRGGDDTSQDLVYTLYSLKALLGTWKGDETEHARFRLGLKGTAEAIRERWPEDLKALHASLVAQLIERLPAPGNQEEDAEVPAPTLDGADEHRLRYVLAHTALSENREMMFQVTAALETLWPLFTERCLRSHDQADDRAAIGWANPQVALGEALRQTLGPQWPPAWQNDLAGVYQNRGNAFDGRGDSEAALADYGQAIALGEVLRSTLGPQWPPAWQNDLAAAYQNRGTTLAQCGDSNAALADFGQAIALGETLRQTLGPQWSAAWQNGLAMVYRNRGLARADRGDSEAALADYEQAIALGEGLRQSLGPQWPLAWQNNLAGAYQNRGLALSERGDSEAALADFEQAIALGEALRTTLGPQWPPAWQNNLAGAYQNRGLARADRGDSEAALADYGQAIALGEALRQTLGPQCPPAWQNDLALIYSNRGVALRKRGDSEAALADYEQAIALGEALRQRLGPQWPPAWQNTLATAYQNRGNALTARGDSEAALADYGQAIALREALRQTLGPQCPPAWQNDLAGVYQNRGVALRERGDSEAALADYGQAIALGKTLRQTLGPQWPAAWQNQLGGMHQNRGNARADRGDSEAALADYEQAIALGEGLRQSLGPQWLPAWQNDLAGIYQNRGAALRERGDHEAALADFTRAITLRETLRQTLGPQCPPDCQNQLATVYMSRGVALYERGDHEAALAEYARAITLGETLRQTLGPQCPPDWQNDLAGVYQNRGVALRERGDHEAALAEYARAVTLGETLRQTLGPQCPPAWQNQLAVVYQNRGAALRERGDHEAALADYARAITIGETLRQTLDPQWPPAWQNQLAGAYQNRGAALRERGDHEAALADYDRAITLGETLRQTLGPQWPPAWQNQLAGIYQTRGVTLAKRGESGVALADFARAITLGETLRETLGPQWLPTWQNDLARIYQNRGVALRERGDHEAALADYARAITLGETLRQTLGSQWLPAWQNQLAGIYQTRGVALRERGDHEAALADYARAITLGETLRETLGPQCPPAWQNRLAAVYQNRGNVLEKVGQSAAAIQDWQQATMLCEDLAEKNSFDPTTTYLEF